MEENQELIYRLAVIEQQMQQIQQQVQAVEQSIADINSISAGLDELTVEKEVLGLVGKGIFARTKLISEELIVSIGGGNLVKKSIPETKELIKQQIDKLEEARKGLNENLGIIGKEFEKIVEEAQAKEREEK